MPALKIDGARVQGTHDDRARAGRAAARPAAVPGRPGAARRRSRRPRPGATRFQQIPRGIIWWALKREPEAQRSFLEDAQLGTAAPDRPADQDLGAGHLGGAAAERLLRPDGQCAARAIPAALDRIDGWIADGVLNGAQPERGRLPDRAQRAAADDLRGPERRRSRRRPAGPARQAHPAARRPAASRRSSRRSGWRPCEPHAPA